MCNCFNGMGTIVIDGMPACPACRVVVRVEPPKKYTPKKKAPQHVILSAPERTKAKPGSLDKVEILRQRVARKQEMWCEADEKVLVRQRSPSYGTKNELKELQMADSYAFLPPTSAQTPGAVDELRSVLRADTAVAALTPFSVNADTPGMFSHKGDTVHDMFASEVLFNANLNTTLRITIAGVEQSPATCRWVSARSIMVDFEIFSGSEIIVESLL